MQQCWRYKRGWPVDSFLIHLLEFNRKSWLKSGRSTPFTTFTIVPLEHFLQNIWITDSFQVGRPSCVTIFIDRERYKIIGTDNMKVAAGESICMWRPCSNTHVFDTRFTISRLLLVKSISYQIQPFPSRSFKGSHKKYHWFLRMLPSAALFAAASWLAFLQPNCPTASSHQTINIFRVSPRPSAFFGCPKLYKHTGTKFDLNLHASFTNLGVRLSSSQMVLHRMERCAFQFDHCS